jgi:hypothetical protein
LRMTRHAESDQGGAVVMVYLAAGYVSSEGLRRRATDEDFLGCATIKRVMSVIALVLKIRELFRRQRQEVITDHSDVGKR